MTNSMFNPQTQYTGDVGEANRQGQANASESAEFIMNLIKTDEAHRASNNKLISQIGPLIGQYHKIKEHREKTLKTEAEQDLFFDAAKDVPYGIQVGDRNFENGLEAQEAFRALEYTGVTNETAIGGNVEIAQALFNSGGKFRNTRKKLVHGADMYEEMLMLGGAHVKLTRANGDSFTRDGADTVAEYQAAQRAIRGIYLSQFMDDGTSSMRKKYLYEKMKVAEQNYATQWIAAKRTSIKKGTELELQEELSDTVNEWVFPGEFDTDIKNPLTEYIQKSRGVYGGTDEDGQALGDLGTTKRKVFGKLNDLATNGFLDQDQAEKIGNSWFKAEDGSRQQVKKYFKKEFDDLTNAAVTAKSNELTIRNTKVNNEITEWGLSLEQTWANQGEPVTNTQLEKAINDFRSNPAWRGRKLPEGISKWYTMEDEDDDEIKRKIIAKAANLLPIDLSELGGIQDPQMKLNLIKEVQASNLSALDSNGIEKRDDAITGLVAEKLDEFDALTTKSSNYRNAIIGATKHYNAVYAKVLAENPGDRENAHLKALETIEPLIASGKWEKRAKSNVNNEYSQNVSKTYDAISASKGAVIHQKVLPAVSKQDLHQGLKALNNEGATPAIFYDIAKNASKPGQHIDPWDVMFHQVNAGLREEGAPELKNIKRPVVLDEMRKALKPEELYAVNKSQAGLNKVLKENDDVDWFLTSVQDETAMANGAFNYVQGPDGGDAHLEKPLTEHTIEEVLGLIGKGYGNLTAYGMTPRQFIDAYKTSGLGLDAVLDEDTQKALAFHAAIVNIKRNNDLTGFYGSNEIADLTDQDRTRISSIAGTVESDWNTIENLVSSKLY